MPYIQKENRVRLDGCIENMVKCLRGEDKKPLQDLLGDINYCFSRVINGTTDKVCYNNIAMITGVLENIKQEFYRRVASPYEDKKAIENGDIKEYEA